MWNNIELRMNLKELREKILHFNECYEKGSPAVSDAVYDFYKKQLKILENKNNISSDKKISNIIGYHNSSLEKNPHLFKILSLDHDFNINGIANFLKKIEKKISPWPIIGELKIDGVSIVCRYENGLLISIKTRGNGTFGEDITYLKSFLNLPDEIYIKELIELRFEAYLEKDVQKNSRNIVAGLLMKKVFDEKLKHIKFAPHNLYSHQLQFNYLELRNVFEQMHLQPITPFAICENAGQMLEYFNKIKEMKENLPCEIDGIVFKINEKEKEEKLGTTSSAPKFAFAIKFDNSFAISKINSIEFNITRNGLLIPMACVEPVSINNKIIKKISLYNVNNLMKNAYAVDDIIKIELAGEIIPKITEIVEKSGKEAVKVPSFCPSCNALLKNFECPSAWQMCPEQKLNVLSYFASKNCFNLKNISIAQIKFFINENLLNDPSDFFTLKNNFNKIKNFPVWLGEKSWQNIIENIENSKKENVVGKFYASIGLPHVSKNKSVLIEKNFNNAEQFLNASVNQLLFLGEKIATDIYNFKEKEKKWLINLLTQITASEKNLNNNSNSLFD